MNIVILLSSLLLVLLANRQQPAAGQLQKEYLATVGHHRHQQQDALIAPTMQTDEQAPTGSGESVEEDDSMCTRCYGRIKEAKESTKIYNHLEDKQKKLISDRQKQISAASASSMIQAPSPPLTNNSNNRRSKQQQNAPLKTQSRNMTTLNEPERQPQQQQPATEGRQIVVSRLRVISSVDDFEEFSHSVTAASGAGSRQRDPALKRIKHKLEKQLNKTCKAFNDVQQCLNDISDECIGDLQYHSHEVFTKQWLIRLNCPPINDPNFKPFAALTRSIPRIESAEKIPIPRPLTTPEETRKRLDAILGGRSVGPFGVMLKPTLSSSAAQKFDAMGPSHINQFKGFEHAQSKSSFQFNDRQRHLQSDFIPMTGQLLLIPCLLVLMVALISLAHRYFNNRLQI